MMLRFNAFDASRQAMERDGAAADLLIRYVPHSILILGCPKLLGLDRP